MIAFLFFCVLSDSPTFEKHRAGKRVTKLSKNVGSSTAKEITQFASSATDWGSNQLQRWGLLGDDSNSKNSRRFGMVARAKGSNGSGDGRRPLGVSFDLGGIFGDKSRSLYSAPAAGGTRKPGYRGDPVIPVSELTCPCLAWEGAVALRVSWRTFWSKPCPDVLCMQPEQEHCSPVFSFCRRGSTRCYTARRLWLCVLVPLPNLREGLPLVICSTLYSYLVTRFRLPCDTLCIIPRRA